MENKKSANDVSVAIGMLATASIAWLFGYIAGKTDAETERMLQNLNKNKEVK